MRDRWEHLARHSADTLGPNAHFSGFAPPALAIRAAMKLEKALDLPGHGNVYTGFIAANLKEKSMEFQSMILLRWLRTKHQPTHEANRTPLLSVDVISPER